MFSSEGRPADWNRLACNLGRAEDPRLEADDVRVLTEGLISEHVPPHVFGLTWGGRDTDLMLLDTDLGLIYWYECPGEVYNDPCKPMVHLDHYGMADDGEISMKEAEWRGDSKYWAIPDFFEVLKDNFRKLRWIPLDGGKQIIEVSNTYYEPEVGAMLQNIFREHGWPNLDELNKVECQKAVRCAMHQKFPDDDLWTP